MESLKIISAKEVRIKRDFIKKKQQKKIEEQEIRLEIFAILRECLAETQANIFAAIDNEECYHAQIHLPYSHCAHYNEVKKQLIEILKVKGYFVDGFYVFWDEEAYEGFQE